MIRRCFNLHDIFWWHKVLALFVCWALAGCVTGASQSESVLLPGMRAGAKEARLTVFVQLRGGQANESWVQIRSVALVGRGGIRPLGGGDRELAAEDIGQQQRFLARGVVAEDDYKFLRLTIDKAALQRQGEKIMLAVENPVVNVPLPENFHLRGGESRCLILAWDTMASVQNDAFFAPIFNLVSEPEMPLLADLAYVSCPAIDTIYLIRTDTNRVFSSLAITGRPTFMAYTDSRKKLYVLSEETGIIQVVEVATGRIIDRFKVPLTRSASYFMSTDGQYAYVLAEQDNELLRMDLLSGTLETRRRLLYHPFRLIKDEEQGQLIVSATLSQALYFLDPLTLQNRDSLAVGSGPQGLLKADSYLYVAEGNAHAVAIIDSRSRQISKRLNVGFSPKFLAKNQRYIFVSNQGGKSLSIISLGQQRVVREIPLPAAPGEIGLSSSRVWAYVSLPEYGSLAVVDQTSHRLVQVIELGAAPCAVLFLD